jgi:hypothetical protein
LEQLSENSAPTQDGRQGEFGAGVEDAILLPFAALALVTRDICKAAFSILIRFLDYAFPIILQLVRIPLFAIRLLGDGVAALLSGLIRCLPVSHDLRENWRTFLIDHWTYIRRKFSYRAFETALHHAFESGMEWVFRKCRMLSPSGALLVLAGALLWIPISFGGATLLHAVLIARALELPPWMQLLHPCATVLAKSKILVLPVYPAAWPQAKKHPFVRALSLYYERFTDLRLVRKAGYRYHQMDRAFARAGQALHDFAAAIGLPALVAGICSVIERTLGRLVISTASLLRIAGDRLSKIPFVSSAVRRYAEDHPSADSPADGKFSNRVGDFFARWSIHFSPEYYEAKEKMRHGPAAPSA